MAFYNGFFELPEDLVWGIAQVPLQGLPGHYNAEPGYFPESGDQPVFNDYRKYF